MHRFRTPVPIIMRMRRRTKGIMMIVMMIDCFRTPGSIILRMRMMRRRRRMKGRRPADTRVYTYQYRLRSPG